MLCVYLNRQFSLHGSQSARPSLVIPEEPGALDTAPELLVHECLGGSETGKRGMKLTNGFGFESE